MDTSMLRRSTLALATALALTACGGSVGPGGVGDDAPDLAGDWVLTSGTSPTGEVLVRDDVPVTLSIDGEDWGGTAHCNSYGGIVEVDGTAIEPTEIAVTEMACADADLMDAEQRYFEAFTASRSVDLDGDTLTLTGEGSELRYERAAPAEDATFEGTTWVLDSLVEGTGPDGAVSTPPVPSTGEGDAVTLTFDGDQVRGASFCNRFGGGYTLDGEPDTGATLTFGELDSSAADCPEGLQQAEDHLLAVVGPDGPIEVVIEGERLTLTAGERGLSYRAEG
jgi:heat shock protein HslJ